MYKFFTNIAVALIESIPALLIVIGFVLIAVGAAGGVSYQNYFPIADVWGRLGMAAIGLGLVIFGAKLAPPDIYRIPRASRYGFVITLPKREDGMPTLPRYAKFSGTYRKEPPSQYEARMLRGFPRTEEYYPLEKVTLDKEKKRWKAECDLGPSKGAHRFVGIYLVGPSGQALVNYFKDAARVHNPLVKETPNPAWLPNLKVKTADMVESDTMEVIVGDDT